MLEWPASRLTLIAVLRRAAMICGPAPVRTAEWSAPKVRSRTRCRVLSGGPGALLRRGPVRTVRATRRGTRLKGPTGAVRGLRLLIGAEPGGWMSPGAGRVSQAGADSTVLGDGATDDRRAHGSLPALPGSGSVLGS